MTTPYKPEVVEADAQRAVSARFDVYQQLASLTYSSEGDSDAN